MQPSKPQRQRKRQHYIREWMEMRGVKPADVTRATGAGKDLVSKWRNNGVNPTEEYLADLAELLGTTREGLFHHPDGDMDMATIAGAVPIEAAVVSWVSAGLLSSDSALDEAIGTAKAVLPPGDWIALRVDGESMDRISPPGSIIFVDRRDKRLVNGGFYVIDDGEGGTTYKRFRANPMRFEPVSKNKDLPVLYPDNEPTIVGRVKLTTLDLT